jgi:three-Cys-motif partner protein
MPGIHVDDFFRQKRSASEIKSQILSEYFKAWAAILLHGQKYKRINKITYIDLFSGPGRYDDGKPSTPIKILDSIIDSEGTFVDFNKGVQTIFNDKDKKLINRLKDNINALSYYDRLKHKPIYFNQEASHELLHSCLTEGVLTLTFLDPLGYGYDQSMLFSSVQSWGSDLFVLFNVNRIRAAVMNDKVRANMRGIFSDYLKTIQQYYIENEKPHDREAFIVGSFERMFIREGYKTMKFKVNFIDRNQTSHYLFFISKVDLAIQRAKEIMTKYSDVQPDGVPLLQ